jgi:hypothetical protein
VQPIDGSAGDVFCHALDIVVVSPVVVAIEVAVPFGEQIRDDRMEFAGLQPRPDIWIELASQSPRDHRDALRRPHGGVRHWPLTRSKVLRDRPNLCSHIVVQSFLSLSVSVPPASQPSEQHAAVPVACSPSTGRSHTAISAWPTSRV